VPPLVTIMLPTYRRPALLRRALESVLAQTFHDLEVQVCDNASGDETAEIVRQFARRDGRVKYIVRERNLGMRENFIRAVDDVRAPFFTILNDDDFMFPGFIETALAALKRCTEARLFCGVVLYATEDGTVLNAPAKLFAAGLYQPPKLMKLMRSHTWNGVLFRSELIAETGGLNPEVTASDTDLLWRIAARWPIVLTHDLCGVFLLHQESLSTAGRRAIFLDGLRMMYRRARSEELQVPVRARLLAMIGGTYLRMTLQAIDAGEHAAAAEAGRVLGQEMNRRISGACLARIADSERLRQIFLPVLRATRNLQAATRRRRCQPYNEVVRRTMADLARLPVTT
jgi:glycosyltransferase involved in cell wall biosynthesis